MDLPTPRCTPGWPADLPIPPRTGLTTARDFAVPEKPEAPTRPEDALLALLEIEEEDSVEAPEDASWRIAGG